MQLSENNRALRSLVTKSKKELVNQIDLVEEQKDSSQYFRGRHTFSDLGTENNLIGTVLSKYLTKSVSDV